MSTSRIERAMRMAQDAVAAGDLHCAADWLGQALAEIALLPHGPQRAELLAQARAGALTHMPTSGSA